MPFHRVNVKWNKQVFNLEINSDEEPTLFKAQLYALTSVPIERQKVLYKGKQLQNDTWANIEVKDNITFLLLGSQDDVPVAPEQKTVFVEDLTENQAAQLSGLPAGLENLGNTCFVNATVQCLRTVPELRQKLKDFSIDLNTGTTNSSSLLTSALRNLYELMDKKIIIEPHLLMTTLLKAIPRFAENLENGSIMQQDANECWTELMRMLKSQLKAIENSDSRENSHKHESFIDQYFGGVNEVTLKCTESESEAPSISKENFLQLSCFINTDVKHLISGLKARLEETITKFSSTLNHDAVYLKTSKIDRLPSYLSIQMVRFYYKEREALNAKILKDIKFSLLLDVYDLCTANLQEKLLVMRNKFKQHDDRLLDKRSFELDEKSKADQVKKAKYKYPHYFKHDLGSNNSGFYELQAVLTHKGRSSNVGHYVAWIKEDNKWFKCDDDTVTQVTDEDILKLSGGGDWHCAYVLLYGSRILEVEQNEDGTPVY